MARKKQHLGVDTTELSQEDRLCRKWCTSIPEAANSLERAHQDILEMVRQPDALKGMKKRSQVYFAQKIEFEELYKAGKVECLWDYYQTKAERLKFWRELEGKEYDRYMDKIDKNEKQYH